MRKATMAKKRKNKSNEIDKGKNDLISPDIYPVDTYIQYSFLLALFLIPLAVRLKLGIFISPFISIGTISTGMQASFFSYYKWIILIILTIIITSLFVYKMLKHKYLIRASYVNLPIVVLVIIILLSTLLADYKMVALTGYYDQHNGVITFLCCFILMIIAANTPFTEKFGRRLTLVLGAVTVLMASLSLVNYLGINLTQNNTVRILLAGREHAEYAHGFLSSTLGNQNYSSGLAAALFCYFAAMLIWGRKLIHPVFTLLFAVAALSLLLTSLSSSGIVAAFIGVIGLVLIAGYDFGIKKLLLIISATMVAGVLLFLSFAYLNPQLSGEVHFWKQYISINQPAGGESAEKSPVNLLQQTDWLAAGSGRGYIWANTIELIADKPLLGHGANTLAYYFPHNNPEKNQNFMASRTIVDKPHNACLGFAFDFGIIALLFLLYLFCSHLFHNGRQIILFRSLHEPERVYQIAMLGFLLAYWIQGLFNDFVIGSAPLHWILLGLAISIYHSRTEKNLISTDWPTKK